MNSGRRAMGTWQGRHAPTNTHINKKTTTPTRIRGLPRAFNQLPYHQHKHNSPVLVRRTLFSASGGGNNNGNSTDAHADYLQQMEELKQEREDLYGFTDEEQTAWSNAGKATDSLPPSLMQSIEQARAEAGAQSDPVFLSNDDLPIQQGSGENSNVYEPSHGLTHLSEDGSSVNMVDVGHKTATKRIARAETRMILPPEVLEAFSQGRATETELVGPKGPIFATAKIAGIMAAK